MALHVLENRIQPYAWGSRHLIAGLRGAPPAARPEAELWIGAHPAAPSAISGRSLIEHVRADPLGVLGPATAARGHGELPFLLKLLAAERPLSIQCHPDAEQARRGFHREEAAAVPRDARHRTYRDPHAKPELVVALTEFSALEGFRAVDEIAAHLRALTLPELAPLAAGLAAPDGLARLVAGLLELPVAARPHFVERLTTAAGRLPPDIAAAIRGLAAEYPADGGVLAPALLNLVTLAPLEGLFLEAGTLHAYLSGLAVEIMGSSDNVLRGGLTEKHVDVPELLAIGRFRPSAPARLTPGPDGAYPTAGAPFRLETRPLPLVVDRRELTIVLVTAGRASLSGPGQAELSLGPTEAALIEANTGRVELGGEGRVFLASGA